MHSSNVRTIKPGHAQAFDIRFDDFRYALIYERGSSSTVPLVPAHGASDIDGEWSGWNAGSINDGDANTNLMVWSWPKSYPAIWVPNDSEVKELDVSWQVPYNAGKYAIEYTSFNTQAFFELQTVEGEDAENQRVVLTHPQYGGWWRIKAIEPKMHVWAPDFNPSPQPIASILNDVRFYGTRGPQSLVRRVAGVGEGAELHVHEDNTMCIVTNQTERDLEVQLRYNAI